MARVKRFARRVAAVTLALLAVAGMLAAAFALLFSQIYSGAKFLTSARGGDVVGMSAWGAAAIVVTLVICVAGMLIARAVKLHREGGGSV